MATLSAPCPRSPLATAGMATPESEGDSSDGRPECRGINLDDFKELVDMAMAQRKRCCEREDWHQPLLANWLARMSLCLARYESSKEIGLDERCSWDSALEVAQVTRGWYNNTRANLQLMQDSRSKFDKIIAVPRHVCLPMVNAAALQPNAWGNLQQSKSYDFAWHPCETGTVWSKKKAPWMWEHRVEWIREVSAHDRATTSTCECVCGHSHFNWTKGFWMCKACYADTQWPHLESPCQHGLEDCLCDQCKSWLDMDAINLVPVDSVYDLQDVWSHPALFQGSEDATMAGGDAGSASTWT